MAEIPTFADIDLPPIDEEELRGFNEEFGPRVRPLIPDHSLLPSVTSEKEEILNGIIDIRGLNIGQSIVENLLFDPSINRLVIMGQPGAGKTTLLYQVDHSLASLAEQVNYSFERSVVLYDSALRMASLLRHSTDTPQFNETLVEYVLHPQHWTRVNVDGEDTTKKIVLAEIPAVGYTQPKDRGVSAVEKLARDTDDTLFLYIVAHPLSQVSGLDARFTTVITPVEDVIRVLAQRYKIIIEEDGVEDEEALGRKIKNAVKWTAEGIHVKTIIYELDDQFRKWRHLDREVVKRDTEKILLPKSYNPTIVQGLLKQGFEKLYKPENLLSSGLVSRKADLRAAMPTIEAAYAEYRFRRLGVADNRYIVAFSPYTEKPIHLYIKA